METPIQNDTDNNAVQTSAEELSQEPVCRPKKQLPKFLKFLVFTLPAGCMQFGSIYLFEQIIGLQHWLAFLIGFACATAWNFTFTRKKTFGTTVYAQKAVPRILLFYAVFTSLATLFNYLWQLIPWGEYVFYASYLATFLTMIANSISTFLVCRRIARVCAKPKKELV